MAASPSEQPRSQNDLDHLLHASQRAHAFILECKDVAKAYEKALSFAKGLNCSADQVPCDGCQSCAKIEEANHPDVFVLEKLGKSKQISMDTIRQVLLPKLANLPHEAKQRVVIVKDCSELVGPTNHALLKTLEEPPPRTIFVLCAASRRTLLPTILSRCQFYKVKASPNQNDDDATDQRASEIYDAFLASTNGKMSALDFVDKVAAPKANVPNTLVGLAKRLHQELRQKEAPHSGDAKTVTTILKFQKRIHQHNAHAPTALMAMMAEIRQINMPVQ